MDFKQFVAESVVTKQGVFMLNEGIDHIESLPPEEFIKAVEGIADFIVSEKLDDGQFDESSLTFGDLTTIKAEVVAALSAYYHARVEYPGFPTASVVDGS